MCKCCMVYLYISLSVAGPAGILLDLGLLDLGSLVLSSLLDRLDLGIHDLLLDQDLSEVQ